MKMPGERAQDRQLKIPAVSVSGSVAGAAFPLGKAAPACFIF